MLRQIVFSLAMVASSCFANTIISFPNLSWGYYIKQGQPVPAIAGWWGRTQANGIVDGLATVPMIGNGYVSICYHVISLKKPFACLVKTDVDGVHVDAMHAKPVNSSNWIKSEFGYACQAPVDQCRIQLTG